MADTRVPTLDENDKIRPEFYLNGPLPDPDNDGYVVSAAGGEWVASPPPPTGVSTEPGNLLINNSGPFLRAASIPAALTDQGYAVLRVVETVDDIPPGTPPNEVFLVMDAPAPAVPPQVIGAQSASETTGTSVSVPLPVGTEEGDYLFVFCVAQTDSAASWSSAQVSDQLVTGSDADLRTVMVGWGTVGSSPPANVTATLSESDQRRIVVVVAVRGVGAIGGEPAQAGTPVGLNGVGSSDTVLSSQVSSTAKALVLTAGWSNGNTGSSQDPSAPGISGENTPVAGATAPAVVSGGFTTLRVFARAIEAPGGTGTTTLDWPLVSQRAGVTLLIPGVE